DPFIGHERSGWYYSIGSVLRAGGKVAFGSDWTVSSANPFEQIEVAITRADPLGDTDQVLLPQERISLEDALQAFTLNAAFVNHLEEQTGSIEVGKQADLALLDQNLFRVAPAAISDTKVLLTLFEGKVVYGHLDGL
ncbi:MAG: amidohydrolase family protein, partial [Pseudomonadales bacterium]|nr:amidohydrolase family protein [Pseudomonadales bacterium]